MTLNTFIISNNKSGLGMWLNQGNKGILIKNGYDLANNCSDNEPRSGVLIGGRFIKRKRIFEAIQFALSHPQLVGKEITVFGDGLERENIFKRLGPVCESINFVGFISIPILPVSLQPY